MRKLETAVPWPSLLVPIPAVLALVAPSAQAEGAGAAAELQAVM